MNEYVEECRREWRRLGVSNPIANEMAADLWADIEEAESEGVSPRTCLGTVHSTLVALPNRGPSHEVSALHECQPVRSDGGLLSSLA